MRETRSSIILTRLAEKKRKDLKDNRYRSKIETERPNLQSLVWISCTRPIRMLNSSVSAHFLIPRLDLLCTEPLVSSFSVRHLRS